MPSSETAKGRARARVRRRVLRISTVLGAAASLLLPFVAGARMLPANAASSPAAFSFNWKGQPTSPQAWTPGAVNDWDLFSNIDGPVDRNGTMNAGHGSDCGAPPAVHQ